MALNTVPVEDDDCGVDLEKGEVAASFGERAAPTTKAPEGAAGGSALDSCSGSTLSCVKWMQYFRLGLFPLRMCSFVTLSMREAGAEAEKKGLKKMKKFAN